MYSRPQTFPRPTAPGVRISDSSAAGTRLHPTRARRFVPVPKGQVTIAQRFNVGFGRRRESVPKGRLSAAVRTTT